MLRQRCTSGDKHQYHIDQMQNFLKHDIVWESRKEILSSPYPQNPTLVVQSCRRGPKAPALSLVNQDLLYLKKGNSGSKNLHQKHSDLERVYHFQLDVESYQQNVNLTAPTITFPRIEKKKMFSIITEPIHGIIYKNSKK
ncbi:hypothetical protein Tco_1402097 [Tanacetum coccineum]